MTPGTDRHTIDRHTTDRQAIDRRALVERHSPRLRPQDDAVASVGNGRFAAGVDITGTQSFCGPGWTETRLNTLAEWGWHTAPDRPEQPWASLLRTYATPRGGAEFMDLEGGTEDPGPLAGWFRENPHKVSLLRFHLVERADGPQGAPREITPGDITAVSQHLDLWTGLITSRFRFRGRDCTVLTAADPELDALALRIDAPGLELMLSFPGATGDWDRAAGWDDPAAHSTRVDDTGILRRLDDFSYRVEVHGGVPSAAGAHDVLLGSGTGDGAGRSTGPGPGDGAIDVVLELSPTDAEDRPAGSGGPRSLHGDLVRERSARFWQQHWQQTGAIELDGGDDARAQEIERRVVLSRYIQRVHAAGTLPPAETGLLANSWRGKFHLEMHWWHAAHFALWGDADSLRRSLGFYSDALPVAQETARRQRCRGARWPKQIGPDLLESPSDIGPFLLWQQPHPIHLAELLRRADPAAGQDPRLQEVVEQSALCLVDLLRDDGDRLGLGGPLIGAQERHVAQRAHLQDPAFELAYATWALLVADRWRHLRGARDAGELSRIARRIHSPLTAEGQLRTFRSGPAMDRSDHPSHLLAYGMVPPTGTIPTAAASRALDDVLAQWDWESTWGWDYPAMAMTAARLQRPDTAVDALLLPTVKNRMDAAGHFPQRAGLPAYLPANGGTLIAVALMAAGWGGGPPRPGLPPAWGARIEGVIPLPD